MRQRRVDAAARRRAAELIRQWIAGELTNDQFEDAYPVRTGDPAVSEIFWVVWGTYDDLHEHSFEGSRDTADELELLARFLETGRPYVHASPPGCLTALFTLFFPVWWLLQLVTWGRFGRWYAPRPSYWPFATLEDELIARRNLGDRDGEPAR